MAAAGVRKGTGGFSWLAGLLAVVALQMAPVGSRAETLIERGKYLVEGIGACGSCHTPHRNNENVRQTKERGPLSGGPGFQGPGYRSYAANITPDDQTGIGTWTPEMIVTAIREGKRPDGTTIGPPMPFGLYRGISDRDARAMAAYLKSVPPVRHEVRSSQFDTPLPDRYGPPPGNVPDPPRSDIVAYGAYLAGPLGRCIECHTTPANGSPDYERMLGAGGTVFAGSWGEAVAGNITPDVETGLGGFSDDQIRRMVAQGIRPNRSRESLAMPHAYFGRLTRADLDAIVAYLRSLKPIRNFIDK